MFHRWAALVLVLALCAISPKNAAGQTQSAQPRGTSGGIGKNYPNPFNPSTTIPFVVGDTANNCANDRQQHVVTLQIRNILAQTLGIPILWGPAAGVTTSAPASLSGQAVNGVTLSCGVYASYWDGNVRNTTREAASGMIIAVLSIDGKVAGTLRMYNKK
jgi:hypothetical protein